MHMHTNSLFILFGFLLPLFFCYILLDQQFWQCVMQLGKFVVDGFHLVIDGLDLVNVEFHCVQLSSHEEDCLPKIN